MRTASVVLMVLLACGPATAGTFTGGSGETTRAACRADAYRLCGAVIRDTDRRRACMRDHTAQLSQGCRAALGW